MTALLRLYDDLADRAQALAAPALPSLARLLFAGILLVYYWGSASTKIGASILSPSSGAYIQIFPKAVEAAGYDPSKLSALHTLVVVAGMWAEFLLPALIVLGLFTRLAALGMIGFIAVQSWVDVFGHGLAGPDIGAWFDRNPSALLLDQRALWLFLLVVLLLKGAGPVSADRLLSRIR
ncbi:MAG: DoxX family membrane protein [Paracoccaceae bacterium]|nr:DoxX family membrane protein [Paracoccaceae bacterium]